MLYELAPTVIACQSSCDAFAGFLSPKKKRKASARSPFPGKDSSHCSWLAMPDAATIGRAAALTPTLIQVTTGHWIKITLVFCRL